MRATCPLLAKAFGVTADWLLSDEDPADEVTPEDPVPVDPPQGHPYASANHAASKAYPDWVDRLPDFIARLIRQYGWLVGLRMAIAGAIFTAMGFVARVMFTSMNNYANEQMNGMPGGFGGGVTFYDASGNVVSPGSLGLSSADLNAMGLGGSTGFGGFDVNTALPEPFTIFTGFIIILGLVMLVGGALLAWYLKKWGSES